MVRGGFHDTFSGLKYRSQKSRQFTLIATTRGVDGPNTLSLRYYYCGRRVRPLSQSGRPVLCLEVFSGWTGDPSTLTVRVSRGPFEFSVRSFPLFCFGNIRD